jgi:hypothetical protein
MDLHHHKETIENVSETHPKLGILFLILTPILAFFSAIIEISSLEHSLTIANLIGALIVKLLTVCSFIVTVVIYWDKITVNLRQISVDFKEKFQKKK